MTSGKSGGPSGTHNSQQQRLAESSERALTAVFGNALFGANKKDWVIFAYSLREQYLSRIVLEIPEVSKRKFSEAE